MRCTGGFQLLKRVVLDGYTMLEAAEEYGHQTFYILSNIDTLTAVRSDDCVIVCMIGTISREELKQIIDSIGEPS